MGQLTRAQIVEEGMRLGGRTDLTTQANIWLNAWLRGVYRSWTWPFLHKRKRDVALSSGATSLSFGAGSSETLEVQHIFDPIRVYTSDKQIVRLARATPLLGSQLYTDEDMVDWTAQSASHGTPYQIRIRPDESLWGKWTLHPYPVPDRAYLLAIDYIVQPADISSDVTRPIYPADETMIQAVKVQTLNFSHMFEEYLHEKNILDEMRGSDKIKYGVVQGVNDRLNLDPQFFRSTDVPSGLDWWFK